MIRKATSKDIPGITRLLKSEPGVWQKAWSNDVLQRALKSSNGLAYVWDTGEIQGFICGHDTGFRGYLSELVVGENHRRKGIGTRLVLRLQDALMKRGCHVIIADIWHEAELFYESMGWAESSNQIKLVKMDLVTP